MDSCIMKRKVEEQVPDADRALNTQEHQAQMAQRTLVPSPHAYLMCMSAADDGLISRCCKKSQSLTYNHLRQSI